MLINCQLIVTIVSSIFKIIAQPYTLGFAQPPSCGLWV